MADALTVLGTELVLGEGVVFGDAQPDTESEKMTTSTMTTATLFSIA